VNDDVGLGESGQCVEREQARIARPGTSQPDVTGLQDRELVVQRREGIERILTGQGLSSRSLAAKPAAIVRIV
jgi:hypothetical protein